MKGIFKRILKVTVVVSFLLGICIFANNSVVQAKIEMEDNTKKS